MKCSVCGIESNEYITDHEFKKFGDQFFCPQCYKVELMKNSIIEDTPIKVEVEFQSKLKIKPQDLKGYESVRNNSKDKNMIVTLFQQRGLEDDSSVYYPYVKYVKMGLLKSSFKSALIVSTLGGAAAIMAGAKALDAFNKFDSGLINVRFDGIYFIGEKQGVFSKKYQEDTYVVSFEEIENIQVKRRPPNSDIYTLNLKKGNKHSIYIGMTEESESYFADLLKNKGFEVKYI